MLAGWLGDLDVTTFRATRLQREAFALPSTVHDASTLLDWDILVDVLASEPAPDVLVVARGALVGAAPPRTGDELAALMRAGAGLCVRHTQRHHPTLARVAREIEDALPGARAQVQLFVTPSQTYGFSWHYDDEDVFIAQTAGRKDYFFRENTVAAGEPARGEMFQRFHVETSPLCTARLHAGDFLYLPARWWHMAVCLEHSLSISVGVSNA